MPNCHPDVEPIDFLIGEWTGHGHGDYPTIDPFDYRETVTFACPPGKPFLAYRQQTWSTDDDRPLHAESGYFRPGAGGSWELVMAQPSGFAEIYAGELRASTLTFESTSIAATPTAKSVDRLRRTISVRDDELDYLVEMAAINHPLQQHLRATLRRVIN